MAVGTETAPVAKLGGVHRWASFRTQVLPRLTGTVAMHRTLHWLFIRWLLQGARGLLSTALAAIVAGLVSPMSCRSSSHITAPNGRRRSHITALRRHIDGTSLAPEVSWILAAQGSVFRCRCEQIGSILGRAIP